jgi:DNA polymerase-1
MPPGAATERIYLIDAHSLIFQVFHATARGGPSMTSPTGLPTNALHGFARDLLYLRGLKPDYLVCACDLSEPTFRSDLCADYKAHRSPMPDDLQLQIPHIWRIVEAFGVPLLSHPRFEADDVMATVAVAAAARGFDVRLCTADKDCRQLLSERVKLYNLRKHVEFGAEELQADWGIKPEQVIDFQTLVGDSVDNVPGVPGIGEKTAATLLQEYGTLENILANIDRIPGAKRKENLQAARATVPLTRQLVRLATDVPVNYDWDAWRLRPLDVPRILELFREFGFRSLVEQVKAAATGSAPRQRSLFDDRPDLDFKFGANSKEVEGNGASAGTPLTTVGHGWTGDYRLADTAEKFDEFYRQLREQKRFAVDLETTGLQPLRADLVGLAFSWREGEAWYVAVRGPAGTPVLDLTATLERLRPILEDPAIAKVNQNIKFDLLVLRAYGINLAGVAGDSMVADYLLNAGERARGKEELASRHLHHQVIPIAALIGEKTRNGAQKQLDEVDPARVAVYAGEDADLAWRLCAKLEKELSGEPPLGATGSPARPSLRRLYDELEVPLIEVLAELEFNGITLDVALLRRLSAEMAQQLQQIEAEIYALAGRTFNIGSLPQLRQILFDELKLPAQRKTGITRAASTDQETLEKLAALDIPGANLPRKILEHRQVAKLKSTYVDALPDLVNPNTGRVHTSFNQTIAATGRLSSSDPNLQNVPVRREQGQQIRQAFVPRRGWSLLTADYSQVELRLLAHFCGDPALRQAFADDHDVHNLVAAQIFGVPEAHVTGEMRRVAKIVNFGVIYGMSAHGLAQRLGIPREEGTKFIDAYFARYPRVLEYQSQLLAGARKNGFVSTILGRRRPFDRDSIRPGSTYQQRNQPEREAINCEIQGSAADLIKLAMLNLYRRMKREQWQAKMLLQIHDELVFEAPPEELHSLAAMVREEMTTALPLEVPLKVDVAAGPNWLDVQELTTEPQRTQREEETEKIAPVGAGA